MHWVPVKCETKSKPNQTKRNETKLIEMKFIETKRNLPKRNEIETKLHVFNLKGGGDMSFFPSNFHQIFRF
jgi:hypothetical protein